LRSASNFRIEAIKISDFLSRRKIATLKSTTNLADLSGESAMNELESGLNKVLEEHQHESGLHIIGGRNRLIARLAEFFEQIVTHENHEGTTRVGGTSH
jgi:hypothetical protein